MDASGLVHLLSVLDVWKRGGAGKAKENTGFEENDVSLVCLTCPSFASPVRQDF
jgi:hypothetical protein